MAENVYFYSAYVPATREAIHGLIAGVCAASARDQLRSEFPETKYLNVHRVTELIAVFNPNTKKHDIVERTHYHA